MVGCGCEVWCGEVESWRWERSGFCGVAKLVLRS